MFGGGGNARVGSRVKCTSMFVYTFHEVPPFVGSKRDLPSSDGVSDEEHSPKRSKISRTEDAGGWKKPMSDRNDEDQCTAERLRALELEKQRLEVLQTVQHNSGVHNL